MKKNEVYPIPKWKPFEDLRVVPDLLLFLRRTPRKKRHRLLQNFCSGCSRYLKDDNEHCDCWTEL